MKVYSPSEIADLLNIKIPTLRKYSIMLEERGYKIERNSQNHRYYLDKDIITLRRVITARNSGVTLDEAIKNIVSIEKDNTYTNAINNTDTDNNDDIKELKEIIHKQNELIQTLTEKMDQQQNYINKRLNKHDEMLMKALNESLEAKKQITATEEKRRFFKKIFRK